MSSILASILCIRMLSEPFKALTKNIVKQVRIPYEIDLLNIDILNSYQDMLFGHQVLVDSGPYFKS